LLFATHRDFSTRATFKPSRSDSGPRLQTRTPTPSTSVYRLLRPAWPGGFRSKNVGNSHIKSVELGADTTTASFVYSIAEISILLTNVNANNRDQLRRVSTAAGSAGRVMPWIRPTGEKRKAREYNHHWFGRAFYHPQLGHYLLQSIALDRPLRLEQHRTGVGV